MVGDEAQRPRRSRRRGAPAGPCSTIAIQSTRSASGDERLHRLGVHRPLAVRARERDGAVTVAASTASSAVRSREQRREQRDGGEERPGRGDVAELLEEDDEVGAAARRRARRTRAGGAHSGSATDGSSMCARTSAGGHSFGEQRPRGVAQQLLVRGEREVHRHQPRGSPRTRWAMMLRWISDEPPAIVSAKLMKNAVHPAAVLLAALGVGDRAVRALELHAELVAAPCRLRRRHLHVRVLGRRRALGEAREALVPERAQARRALVRSPRSAPHAGVAVEAAPAREVDEPVHCRLEPGHALDPQPGALVRERALRDAPAVVEPADEVLARHHDVGEEHLGEVGRAGDVAQRPDLDARRVHVDDQQADALVLRHVGVGAHVAEALLRRSSRSSSTPSGR